MGFCVALFLFIPSWARVFTWHKFLPNQFVGLLLFFFLISLGLHNPLACTLFPFSPFAVFLDLLAYWALFLPLDSHSSFTLLLPLMCLWAHWLSFPAILAHWALTSFLGLSWPICFNCVSSILFLLHLPLLSGFILLLGLLSKTGINI